MDPKVYWVAFNLVKGIGAVRLRALLDYFGSLEVAWQAPARWAAGRRAAGAHPGKPAADSQRLFARAYLGNDREARRAGVDLGRPCLPAALLQIDQPPPVLFVNGSILPEDEWAVAIVGTRRLTSYGHQVASELAAFLAQNGITVVSGLARGIDRVAHEAR
jgi:DNA processing protein